MATSEGEALDTVDFGLGVDPELLCRVVDVCTGAHVGDLQVKEPMKVKIFAHDVAFLKLGSGCELNVYRSE